MSKELIVLFFILLTFTHSKKLESVVKFDDSSNAIVIDPDKCIGCGLCVRACDKVAGQSVLKILESPDGDKKKRKVVVASGKPLSETNCISCGQCSLACPKQAIVEKSHIELVETVLKNPNSELVPVCQTAPAVRINLSDALGLPVGTISTGKMVTALKMLGFKYVFDTNYGADLTIVEEAMEFVTRLTKGTGPLPMFTSCCPAWVNYVEKSAPELIPLLSTCRSPLGMLSSVIQEIFAKRNGLTGKLLNVAIMPCTAKKDEIIRPQFNRNGKQETELVITTRELARMIKKAKIDFANLPDTEFDSPFSQASGAGAIFCGSGGVMEAAIRTAYFYATGEELKNSDIKEVRGPIEGIKYTSVDINGNTIEVAVAQGISNAMELIQLIKNKDPKVANVKFVEVMACPGGCILGGGSTKAKNKQAIEKRVEAVYKIDQNSSVRQSHNNPQVKELYKEEIGEPNGHRAHELFHTHFTDRSNSSN